jgi:hypothetical protein
MRAHAMRQTRSVSTMAMVVVAAAALLATTMVVLQTTRIVIGAPAERFQPVEEEPAERAAPEWGFVERSPGAVDILRHRSGLTPADLLRTHAFGWEGLTIREALSSPELVGLLRHRPGLTALDLVRIGSG